MPYKENSCLEEQDLFAYFYGWATEAEREKIKLHIKSCKDCSNELNKLKKYDEAYGTGAEKS